MQKCLKTLFVALFAVTQAIPGSVVVQANDITSLSLNVGQFDNGSSGRTIEQSGISSSENGWSLAQNDAIVDLEPPLIEHEVVAEAEVDNRQTFVATVVDDQDLDSVVLYYRFAGESNFTRYVMNQVSESSTYIAQIPTDPLSNSAIEYYIQARDVSGNRTVRGYTFSPLVRKLVFPEVVPPTERALEQGREAVGTSGLSKVPKVVYILGGVLLVALIAGIASSSSGGSGEQQAPGGGECTSDGCSLTLFLDLPY